MAKASAQITLHYVIDIKGMYRYYLLQSSTLAKPSVPTTYPPPSSWDDSEPPYVSGSTNSLYFVDCTVFCDDTFSYSSVSLSTSYEAAKEAYNKATAAQGTANQAQSDINNLEIGGRNLLIDSEKDLTTTRFMNIPVWDILAPYIGRTITVSFDARINDGGISRPLIVYAYQNNGITISSGYSFTPTTTYKRYSFTTTVVEVANPNNDGTYSKGEIAFYDQEGLNNYTIRKVKIELGNKATDWTPAVEDMANKNDVDNAVTDLNNAIENIDIGGRNLIRKGDLTSSGCHISVESTDDIEITNVASDGTSIIYIDREFAPGTYTINATNNVSNKRLRLILTDNVDGSFSYNTYYNSVGYPYFKDLTLPVTYEFTSPTKVALMVNRNSSKPVNNLADPTSPDWLMNSGMNSLDGSIEESEGRVITNYIPVTATSKIHIRGLQFGVNATPIFAHYTEDKTYNPGWGSSYHASYYDGGYYQIADYDSSVGIYDFSFVNSSTVKYIRVIGYPTGDISDIAISVDERFIYGSTISGLKLETGNKATDWTPAPEDVQAGIDNAIDNLEIGGSNLLLNSKTMSDWIIESIDVSMSDGIMQLNGVPSNLDSGIMSIENVEGILTDGVLTISESASELVHIDESGCGVAKSYRSITTSPRSLDMIYSRTLTLSFEVRSDEWNSIYNDNNTKPIVVAMNACVESNTTRSRYKYIYNDYDSNRIFTSGKWTKWSTTFDVGDNVSWFDNIDQGGNPTLFSIVLSNSSPWSVEVRKIKLEYGDKATDWSIVDTDEVEKIKTSVEVNTQSIADLLVLNNEISMNVTRVEETVTSSLDGIVLDMETLTNKVDMKMTSEEVKIEIQSELANGVTKVSTETGYTFDDEGMTIARSGSEMKTQITDNGMTVYQNEEPTLTANNVGVDAKNLHATTYLIVGAYSRFEDYGGRTGCFWIGE